MLPLCAVLALFVSASPVVLAGQGEQAFDFDERAAEHLYSRFGFGAGQAEISRAVGRGFDATMTELFNGGRGIEPFHVEGLEREEVRSVLGMDEVSRQAVLAERRRRDRRQMQAYEAWWIERMIAGDDPLRDRMTLFWHGFFTSNYAEVSRSHEMIAQHRLLRDNALESYSAMLQGIVRDPAMLRYLDNDQNRRQEPNENLARELLELFSLGEGNYGEQDIREIARALTGYAVTAEGEFRFDPRRHDRGIKEIFGTRGRHDADSVVRLLLKQPECARHVMRRMLTYLEGVAPDDARLEEYAAVLRNSDYALRPVLEKLMRDPRLYRNEIVGARVAGPIDFLVGMSRRLDVQPPMRLVSLASANLGQALFRPPNVKGWEEGPAWITTASMLQRGNVAGLLLGTVDLNERDTDAASQRRPLARGGEAPPSMDEPDAEGRLDDEGSMGGAMDDAMTPPARAGGGAQARFGRDLLRALGEAWTPPLNMTWRMERAGARTDVAIAYRVASELLAITPPAETLARLERYLAVERDARGIADGELLAHSKSEEVLRRLAHLVLSSPEAQLH